jgi:hypothetical protein
MATSGGVNQGGNSVSTVTSTNSDNLNEETALEPVNNQGGGSSSNTISAEGDVTLNEESPEALTELGQALTDTSETASQALEEEYETSLGEKSLVGQMTQTPTQQIIPIVIALAVVIGAYLYFNRKGA